jgi:hypothetical protein
MQAVCRVADEHATRTDQAICPGECQRV